MRDSVYKNQYGFDIPPAHIPSKEIMGRYLSGDVGVISGIVTGLIDYAVDQVDWFIRQHPSAGKYKEDLHSEAFLALQETVIGHCGKSVVDSTILLILVKRRIYGALRNWITAMGQAITLPHSDAGRNERERLVQEEIQEHHAQSAEADIFSEIWFDDAMSKLRPLVAEVVREKIGGFTEREISRSYGISRKQVTDMIQEAAQELER